MNIDYRCEKGRVLVYASCVTISNPDLLSSSETWVDPGRRSWKNHLSEWARCQKAIGCIYFTKKWRAETLQKLYLHMHLLAERFAFWTDDRCFLNEGVKIHQMPPPSPLNLLTFIFCLHIYSLWQLSPDCVKSSYKSCPAADSDFRCPSTTSVGRAYH